MVRYKNTDEGQMVHDRLHVAIRRRKLEEENDPGSMIA